jgi:hypothetical protein
MLPHDLPPFSRLHSQPQPRGISIIFDLRAMTRVFVHIYHVLLCGAINISSNVISKSPIEQAKPNWAQVGLGVNAEFMR